MNEAQHNALVAFDMARARAQQAQAALDAAKDVLAHTSSALIATVRADPGSWAGTPRANPVKLYADDWYHVASRGPAASFQSGRLPPGIRHAKELMGEQVWVDNLRYVVKGVEHFCIECPRATDAVCTHPFGLLLERVS